MLGCPFMGMDVCFVGKPDALQKALSESAKTLNEFFEENGMLLPANAQAAENGEERPAAPELPDEDVYDVIHFLVRDLEADGAIDCPCGTGPYETLLCEGGILVYCEECKAEHFFPVESVSQAEAFLSLGSLTLSPKED